MSLLPASASMRSCRRSPICDHASSIIPHNNVRQIRPSKNANDIDTSQSISELTAVGEYGYFF